MVEATEETLDSLISASGWVLAALTAGRCQFFERERAAITSVCGERKLQLMLVDTHQCPSAIARFKAYGSPKYILFNDGEAVAERIGTFPVSHDGPYKGTRGSVRKWIAEHKASF